MLRRYAYALHRSNRSRADDQDTLVRAVSSSIYGSLEFRRLWDEARDLGDLALEDEAYERSIVGVDCEFYPGDRRSICALAYSPPYRRWLRGRLGS